MLDNSEKPPPLPEPPPLRMVKEVGGIETAGLMSLMLIAIVIYFLLG